MITNLDELLPEDKKIILLGQELVIPGDIPVKLMLKLIGNTKDAQANPEDEAVTERSLKGLVEVLALRNKVDEEKIIANITIRQFQALSNVIFGVEESDIKKNTTVEEL